MENGISRLSNFRRLERKLNSIIDQLNCFNLELLTKNQIPLFYNKLYKTNVKGVKTSQILRGEITFDPKIPRVQCFIVIIIKVIWKDFESRLFSHSGY